MPEPKVPVVILAGGVNRIELYPGYEPGNKALILFHGKPSLQYTLAAVSGSGRAGEIAVVGPEAELKEAVAGHQVTFIEPGEALLENIIRGISHFESEPRVLIATADIPLVTPEIVREFVGTCEAIPTSYQGNLYLSVVPKEAFTGPFAVQGKGYNRFRDTAICHGNLFLADPRFLRNERAMSRINGMYAARKSPIKSAMAVGLGLGLTYVLGVHLFHLVTLSGMARAASKTFHMGFLPVPCPHPEIALDVDEPADYELVSRILKERVGV